MLGTTAGLVFEQWEQLGSFQLIEHIGTSMACSVQLWQTCSLQWRRLRPSSGADGGRGSLWLMLNGTVVVIGCGGPWNERKHRSMSHLVCGLAWLRGPPQDACGW